MTPAPVGSPLVFVSDLVDPESALLRAGAIQADAACSLRSTLNGALDRVTQLAVRLANLSVLLDQTRRIAETPVTPVTAEVIGSYVDGVIGAVPANSVFAADFANDGPALGTTLAEANALSDALATAGFPVNAPVMYPVFRRVTTINPDRTSTQSDEFMWVSAQDRAALNGLTEVSAVPGEPTVMRYAGTGFVVDYYCLDAFANRRISATALDTTIADMDAVQQTSAGELQQVLTFGGAIVDRCGDLIAGVEVAWKNFVGVDESLRERRKDQRILDNRLDDIRRAREWAENQLARGADPSSRRSPDTAAPAAPTATPTATAAATTVASDPVVGGNDASAATAGAASAASGNPAAPPAGAPADALPPSLVDLAARFFAPSETARTGAREYVQGQLPSVSRTPTPGGAPAAPSVSKPKA